MSDVCKSCRWPVRLHLSGLDCPTSTPGGATADEMWAWLSRLCVLHVITIGADNETTCVIATGKMQDALASKVAKAPTLSDALRAVCAEVMSK